MADDLQLMQRGESVKWKHAFASARKLAQKLALAVILLALVASAAVLATRGLNRNQPVSSHPEALKLYKRAEWKWNHMTREGAPEAFNYLTEAVRLDTNFVGAYYKMFECYFRPLGNELPPHQNSMANMRWVADQIRSVRPRSAEFHKVNSLVLNGCNFSAVTMETKKQLAIAL